MSCTFKSPLQNYEGKKWQYDKKQRATRAETKTKNVEGCRDG